MGPVTDSDADPLLRMAQLRHSLESRWPESRIAPSLDRIRRLTGFLGDPQSAYPVIHVTGTNGKTSTARMIESLLRSFGLRTGLMTSPHLSDLRERVRLAGEPIPVEDFLRIYDEVAPVLDLVDQESAAADEPPLSFFEVMTALGFAAFADAPVDVAIVEVGMGGAWDATNVADGQVAVVTGVGMDHSDYLGDTLAEIAGEKAGIIKPAASVVLAAQEREVLEVVLPAAVAMEGPLAVEGLHFGVVERVLAVGGQQVTLRGLGGEYPEVFLPLFGAHQASNAAVALAAVESFFGLTPPSLPGVDLRDAAPDHAAPDLATTHAAPDPAPAAAPRTLPEVASDVPLAGAPNRLDEAVVRAGFESVVSPGRLEVVRRGPTVVVDAAHNVPGARALADAVAESFSFARTVGVLGILAGKDAAGMLAALDPVLDEVVITRSSSPRAMAVDDLSELAAGILGEDRVRSAERLDAALDLAVELAEAGSPAGVGAGVLVTGSITVVAEARLLLGAESGAGEEPTARHHREWAPGSDADEDLS